MINVEVSGQGLSIVLLHGFCEDLKIWQKLRDSLQKSYQVIAFDLPGFGKSEPLTDNFTIESLSKLVHEHISKSLKVSKYVVLGHSMGGYISLALADNYPNSVIGIGLINSTSFADNEAKRIERNKTIKFIQVNSVSLFLQSFVKNLFTPANQILLSKTLQLVSNMGSGLSEKTLTAYLIAMRDRLDRSYLLKGQKEVLFIAGLHDVLIEYSTIEKQVGFINNKRNCHLLDKTAHMSIYEAPNDVKNAILAYLSVVKKD